MPVSKTHGLKGNIRASKRLRVVRSLGIATDDPMKVVRIVRHGFPFRSLANFQKATELPWAAISRFVAIPPRTLSRRQSQGRLQPNESDRIWRASTIFDLAVQLFDGDAAGARVWLQTPQPALGGETPLDFASTDVGAREVENLIGRLEHGVFA
jgi:putative toxin-antitoxin system antitoxin component (TIGR02293 family)